MDEKRREQYKERQRQYRKAQRVAAKERMQKSGQLDALKARQKELRRKAYLKAKEQVTARKDTARKDTARMDTARKDTARKDTAQGESLKPASDKELARVRQLEELRHKLEKLGPSTLQTSNRNFPPSHTDKEQQDVGNQTAPSQGDHDGRHLKERSHLKLVWQHPKTTEKA